MRIFVCMNQRAKTPPTLVPQLRVLGEPTRLQLLVMLDRQARTVGELVQMFHLSQPTITRHLQALYQAGLVTRLRQGQHVRYAANPDVIAGLCHNLADSFPCCCVTIQVHTRERSAKKEAEDTPSLQQGEQPLTKRKTKGDRQ